MALTTIPLRCPAQCSRYHFGATELGVGNIEYSRFRSRFECTDEWQGLERTIRWLSALD